jgi:histidinol-phosphate aminotransferase
MEALEDGEAELRPVSFIEEVSAYAVPRHPAPIDLRLDGNEGRPPSASLLARLAERSTEILRRYPSARPLEERIARRFSVPVTSVLVTAGADDGLDRACRAMLGPGREIVLPVPTFEMIDRYARAAGGHVRTVPWAGGPYPVDEVLRAVGDKTAVIAIVSPNNPTGAVATAADLERVSRGAPHSLIIFDNAYAEFADEDLTALALSLPNVAVFRTLSKAWGLAGMRVGYVLGPPAILGWLRRSGQPYAVSAPSLALAEMRLDDDGAEVDALVARVREERRELSRELADLGHAPLPSQANFVLCAPRDPLWMRDALAGLGVGVRAWPGHAELGRYVRITCPGDRGELERLLRALRTASSPDAIVLRLEGVLIGAGERLLCERAFFEDLARRFPIAIATSGPPAQAEQRLRDHGLLDRVRCVVGPSASANLSLESSEAPIAEAVQRLAAERVWALCGAPQEVRAARSAGALPLAIRGEDSPEEGNSGADDESLLATGAARVLRRLETFGMLLP